MEGVWLYNQQAGAENLIKEANSDAGLAAHPSRPFFMNRNQATRERTRYKERCKIQAPDCLLTITGHM